MIQLYGKVKYSKRQLRFEGVVFTTAYQKHYTMQRERKLLFIQNISFIINLLCYKYAHIKSLYRKFGFYLKNKTTISQEPNG